MSDTPQWAGEAIFLLGVICGMALVPLCWIFSWASAQMMIYLMYG